MCNFNIKDILQNDVLPIMETVYENYQTIVSIFQEMQSESQESYPFISFDSLREFCEKTSILDVKMLDETIQEPDEDEPEKPKTKGR